MTLNDKNVGDIVKIKENGDYVNYIIVQKGKPSDLYDDSCDGVWLLREYVHSNQIWGDNNDYENSNIHNWLNNDFFNTINAEIRNKIKKVKITYKKGTGDSSDGVYSKDNGLICNVFLLSGNEVGMPSSISSDSYNFGNTLSYFIYGNDYNAKLRRTTVIDNGSYSNWLLNTVFRTSSSGTVVVVNDGSFAGGICTGTYGVRPTFIMPFDTPISPDGIVMPTLGGKNVGDIVKIRENGVLTNYIVVQKGKPSDIYDESCDGVWLLRESIHSNIVWKGTKSSYNNDYENSDIQAWLNGTFWDTIDEKIRAEIKTVKIPFKKGNGNASAGVYSGSDGLSCKVFLLSGYEIGFTQSDYSYFPIDGAKLDYFSDDASRVAKLNGSAAHWWLRSPYTNNARFSWYVYDVGSCNYASVYSSGGVRPTLILPYETTISNNDIIGDEIYYIKKPYLESTSFDYNSGTFTPVLRNFNEVTMTKSGTFSGIYAGEYEIIISLKDPENCAWEDGTTDDVILKWTINPITVPKPTFVEMSFEYEGRDYNKSVTINNYNADLMTKIGTETANKAGKYSVVFSLKDTDSCAWDNGDGTTSVEDVVLEWEITKITVDIPYLSEDEFTYTGNWIYPTRNNENNKVMSVTGQGGAYDVGDYSLTYALYDTDSTTWSDGTIENKILYWKINQQVQTVKIPYLDPTEFEYDATRKAPTIVNYDSGRTIASGILSSVIACGDDPFVINVELKKVPNYLYKWEDDTTDDIVLTWRVNKAILDIPTVDISEFDYDGTTKTAPVSSYNTAIVTRTGTISAVKAGDYSVIYSIRDKNSAEWADGTTDDKTVIWKINKSVFAIPTAENTSFEVLPVTIAYNSSAYSQTLELDNFDTNVMTVSGNSAAYPGIYTATIALRDVSSASWEDGTTENKTIEWKITKKEHLVTKPSLVKDKFQFNGLTQSVSFNNLNDSIFIIRPETSGIKAREYNAVAELRDSSVYNFKWEDGTTEDYIMPWEIEKAAFDKPVLDNNSFDYDGLQKSVTVNGYNSNVMAYDSYSVFNATAARKYSVVVSLKDKLSSTWADGSTDDVILPWVINETTFEIPTVTNTEFTYNGGYQSPTISGFSSNVMTVSGNSAVNAGEYTIIFTLKDATSASWKDGTTEQKKFSWKINKAIAKIDKPYLSDTEFTYNGYTFVYHATNSSYKTERGYVYAYIRNFNSTYSSISGTTRNSSAGDYSIVITLKDTTNYIAQWSDGTTEPLELKWKINKAVFEIPTLSSTHFNYGGRWGSGSPYYYGYKHAIVSGYNTWVMTSNALAGYRKPDGSWFSTFGTYYEDSTFYTPSQWQIGKYYARFGFKDPASATWSDGTNGDIFIEWSISREVVLLKRPYLEATSFEYDGTEKQPVIANNVGEGIVFTGTFKATEVGNYSIVAKLYREFEPEDTRDYRWDDNTVDDIVVMNWNIWSDGVLAAPDVAPLEFTYDGKKHEPVIYGFDENTMTKSGNFSATSMGDYSISFSLKHPDSVTWSDGSTADKVFKWKINKGIAYPPCLSPDDLMYDGNAHKVTLDDDTSGNSYVLYNFDKNTMVYSGDTSVVAAGDYSITVALKDKASCTWSDGTTDNITLPFTVSKKIVLLDKPSLETDEFVFDGVTKTPEILMWKIPGMSKLGDLSATKAGDYKITISLIEDRNITYLWGDHSEEPVELTWKILGRNSANENALKKPEVTSLDFLYDKLEHAPEISDYEKNLISISGIVRETRAGDYKIIFSIKDKDSCTWEDGTVDDYVASWVIRKSEIAKPVLVKGNFTYNKKIQTPIIEGFDANAMQISGNINAVSAGKYLITISLDENYIWLDGTSDTLYFDWEINKAVFEKPTITENEFVYNGIIQKPVFDGFNEDGMIQKGNTSAKNAGDYNISIILDPNYCWSDGTSNELNFDWRIKKLALDKPTLVQGEFTYNGKFQAPVFENFDESGMSKNGDVSAADSGDYSITITPDKNHCWIDDTSDTLSFNWSIKKLKLEKPILTQGEFYYNGISQSPIFDGFESGMVKGGTYAATFAGDYNVTITPDKNHTWLDGTTDILSFDWCIKKSQFAIPVLKQGEFTYNGTLQEPVFEGFDGNVMIKSGDVQKTPFGDYIVTISFKDTNSSEWDIGAEAADCSPKDFTWKINKAFLAIPTLNTDTFAYDGEIHTLEFDGFDPLTMIKTGVHSATAAGDYTAVIALKDNKSSEWQTKTSTPDISDKEYAWRIKKSVLNIPTVTDLTFLYDGKPHAPTVTGFDENVMNISGNTPTINAGEYSVVISLKDKTSATWSDGTTEDKKVDWAITKKSHPKPYLTNIEFTYNGGIHAPAVKDLDVSCAYVSGEQSGIGAGIYHVLIPLRDSVNNMWDDGSSEPLSLEWIIHGKPVAKPYLEKDIFEYDGKTKTPNILGFKSTSMKKSGDLSAADIGKYKITVALGDNYEWADGGFAPTELPWKITEIKVKIPVVTDIEFEYDGTVHEPKIEKLDTSMVIKSGISSAANAGNYKIKFTLFDKTHAVWEDGTSDDIEIEWVIKKRLLKKPVGETLHFIYNGGANRPVIDNLNESVYVSSLYNPPKDLYKYEVYYYGNVQEINVGSYKVIYVIVDKTNYVWEDETNGDITIGWSIGQKPIAKPYLDPDIFQYNGSLRRPSIIGFISNAMSYPENDYNDYSAVEVGNYSITICLWVKGYYKDEYGNYHETILRNYRWEDGDPSDTLTMDWEITKGELDYPNLLQDEFTYNGSSITPPLNNYISSSMNCIGNRSAINAGNYSIGFVLTDTKHYKWKDGIVNGTMLPWRINKAKLPKDSGLPTLVSDLTYNAFEQSPSWSYNTSKFVIADGNKGTTVGEYSTGFKPSSNYTWEDGTDTPIYLKWKILVRTLATPKQLSVLYYNKETQEPNFGYQAQSDFIRYSIKKSEDVSGINADEYYMKLECDKNCKWDSTGTTTCYVPWEIQKCIIYEPTGYNYKYTGEIINAEFNNYHLDALKITGQIKEREVGTYTAYFEIKDNSNYVWHKSVLYKLIDNKVSVKWYISDNSTSTVKKLAIPYQSNSLVYNGEKQEPIFANYNKELMTLIGGIPSETDAGTYYVTFSLKDKTNYTWSDGTTEDKVIPWVIRPQPVPFPYILTAETEGGGMYYYELEGKRYPIWVNYNSDIMTISGDTYDIDNSWHTTYFELKDKKNYVWISHNDAYDKYPVSWKLSEAYVRKPTVSNGKKVHIPKQVNRPIEDGTMKYPKWDSYDNTAIIKLGGEWEGIDAGERFVILELQPGYVWEDDTDEIKAVPWEIFKTGTGSADDGAKILLHIPEQINPPFYDGYVKYPEWDLWADYGFDVIKGVLMEVPAGRYKITLRLKTGYIWEDGTTEDKTVYWIIQPRDINKDYPEDNPSSDDDGGDDPRKPEPETEETPEKKDGGCCNCCCDTGLFDKLNDSYQDDNYECSCQDNS